MVKEENMTKDMQGQELPPSLDFFLNWVGIRENIFPVEEPEIDEEETQTKTMDKSYGWLPSYPGQEPPF